MPKKAIREKFFVKERTLILLRQYEDKVQTYRYSFEQMEVLPQNTDFFNMCTEFTLLGYNEVGTR